MVKKLSDGRFQCSECDYIAKKEGYVRLHEKQKHGIGGKPTLPPAARKCDAGNAGEKAAVCPDCGGVKFRLLRSGVKFENQYVAAGYTKVCVKCNEII